MDSMMTHISAGWAAYHQRDFSHAIKLGVQALGIQADPIPAFVLLASCYKEKKDLDMAIQYCERALQIDENCFCAFRVLSEIYAKKGQNKTACRYIEKAMENRAGLPIAPKKYVALGKSILKLFGLKENQTSSSSAAWGEPEEMDWLIWAEQFKSEYELDQNFK